MYPKATEDYTSPALDARTKLGSLDGAQLEFDEDPAFTRAIVRVQWRVGDPIDLYIIKPVGVKKPKLVVYLYNYPVETEQYLRPEFCRKLVKDGFAAVGFVPALTGQRYHDRPMKEWFVSEMQEALATTTHDVQMTLNYMAAQGDVDVSHVGIYGEGSGATVAILAAAVDSRIQTLDLLAPWGDWPEWVVSSTRIPDKERSQFVTADYLAKVAPFDPLKWLPSLKTQQIRLLNVRSYGETPVSAQMKIEAAAPSNVKIVNYDDEKAFMTAIPRDQRLQWIKAQMDVAKVHATNESASRVPAVRAQQSSR